ncbi:MAG: hypothetical protein WBG92_04790 [Thiohalocapsa sp.]
MLKALHPISGAVALLTILTFWVSTALSELFGPATTIIAVKTLILQKLAMQIHGRAVRRAGELLREIEPARAERTDKLREGDQPKLTRRVA